MTNVAVNTEVTSRAAFRLKPSDGGGLADPGEVTLRVEHPNGDVDVYVYSSAEVTRDSLGTFSKAIVVDDAGEWIFQWEGSVSGPIVVICGSVFAGEACVAAA